VSPETHQWRIPWDLGASIAESWPLSCAPRPPAPLWWQCFDLQPYAVILLANGIAAAQRIAITQNAAPPSDA
jgi:hypothetical protein